MSATTFHGDPLPPPCCPNCDARKAEAVALKTRARLLEESILARARQEAAGLSALPQPFGTGPAHGSAAGI